MSLLEQFSAIVTEALGPVASVASGKTPDATDISDSKQSGSVGSVGSVPKTVNEKRIAEPPPLSDTDREAIREAIAERAAIREIDGGEDRATAEREAAAGMRVFRYRLVERPDTWLTILAPGCDLDDARHSLVLRFGAERLIEVRERAA